MTYDPSNPLIVQSDRSILLEVDNPKYPSARDALAPFAELEKSPEHIHQYRLTDLSLWNAAAAGMTADEMVQVLIDFSKFPLPGNIPTDIKDRVSRYGRVRITRDDQPGKLRVVCEDRPLFEELARQKSLREYFTDLTSETSCRIEEKFRGVIKQALITVGYPAEDVAGYVEGTALPMALRDTARSGQDFRVRDYQLDAVEVYHAGGDVRGGSGVVVLPCGAGKTIVGICAMTKLQKSTLILTTSITSVKQWHREILDKTDLDPALLGEFTGETKEVAPVTLATYQIVTYRPAKNEDFPHFEIFNKRDWGLIIYDEVHLLPAPVFRFTADIQSRRRLGLTATLVREDGREGDVFSLIGPRRYDVPWREMEAQGWIAPADCVEVRVTLPEDERLAYALAPSEERYRMAAATEAKYAIVQALVDRHADDRVLIIGQYLDQLAELGDLLAAPVIDGAVPVRRRQELFEAFRQGQQRVLIVSKVANFSIDLPEAAVAIQVSGSFGSRQEEAQRLGRILRPKRDGRTARFYTIVARDTVDVEFAAHRQRFLAEQGYAYRIIDADDVHQGRLDPA